MKARKMETNQPVITFSDGYEWPPMCKTCPRRMVIFTPGNAYCPHCWADDTKDEPAKEPRLGRLITYPKSPWLWNKAIRDHAIASKICDATWGTPQWKEAYDATWEPFRRIFSHLDSAFTMLCIYGVLATVGLLAILISMLWINR
jgi:hypothetical protein